MKIAMMIFGIILCFAGISKSKKILPLSYLSEEVSIKISIRIFQIKNIIQIIISKDKDTLVEVLAAQFNKFGCSVRRSKPLIYRKSDTRFNLHKCKV